MSVGALFHSTVLNKSVCDCHSVIIHDKIMYYECLSLKLSKKHKTYSLIFFFAYKALDALRNFLDINIFPTKCIFAVFLLLP